MARRTTTALLKGAALTLACGALGACHAPSLTGAPDDEAVLALRAPLTPVYAGKPVLLRLTAWWTSGRDATGEVQLSASAGAFDVAAITLEGGAARASWRCPADEPACLGPVRLEARWEGATATAQILLLAVPDAGSPGDAEDGGLDDAGLPDAGGTDEPRLADAGFVCGDWDGGAHPGYTDALGRPLATGCLGEPIDYVPLESPSPTATHVCGTVELAEPVTEPVLLHGLFTGSLRVTDVQPCCSAPRCLRDPRRITFRFDVEEMHGAFGLGVKWNPRTRSQFGYYAGTVAAPIVDLTQATPFDAPPGTGTITGVDFGVGPGWRP